MSHARFFAPLLAAALGASPALADMLDTRLQLAPREVLVPIVDRLELAAIDGGGRVAKQVQTATQFNRRGDPDRNGGTRSMVRVPSRRPGRSRRSPLGTSVRGHGRRNVDGPQRATTE